MVLMKKIKIKLNQLECLGSDYNTSTMDMFRDAHFRYSPYFFISRSYRESSAKVPGKY